MASIDILPQDETVCVFDPVTALSQLDQQAIIRPDNPPPGIAGFLFDIDEENEINLTSEITDHFIEDNTSIQDQIGIKPEQYTVRGLVAELVAVKPTPDSVAKLLNALPAQEQTAPQLTPGASQTASARISSTNAAIEAVTSNPSLYAYFSNTSAQPPNATRQSKAFLYFYEMWKGRQFCTVETPWGIFDNMQIQSLRVMQGDATKYQSSFTVTFKKIRIAESISTTAGVLAGRAVAQMAQVTQNGTVSKTPVPSGPPSALAQLAAKAGTQVALVAGFING